jgi:hypothetical protein
MPPVLLPQRWNITGPDNPGLLQIALTGATAAGKALYVGEFGDPLPGNRTWTAAVLGAMTQYGATRGTVWVWEFYQAGPTQPPAVFSLLPGRDSEIIAAMQAWNAA